MTLIDSHCHLDSSDFDGDREAVIQRALDAGVERMVAIGTGSGPPDLETGIRLADGHQPLYATVGIHPHDASKATDESLRALESLLKHPKVIAIGEIGLDYHYDFAPQDVQRSVFTEQLHIARAARKPVIIHTREAWDDTFSILRESWSDGGLIAVMHCFSGGANEAQISLDLGFYLSFGGIVTFPKATGIQQAAKQAPLNRILIETDAPYLAPVPKRGRRNEPAFVVHTARKIAELRAQTVDEIAQATTCNFEQLFLAPANNDAGRLLH
jgi:TatD DNase family protein